MLKFPVIVFLFIFVLVLLAALAKAKQQQGKKPDTGVWPYKARSLLTEREQAMYYRLREAFPDYLVMAQVAMSQVIVVKPRTQNAKSWFNKVSQKSLDFVICRADSSVVAAIELDDSSHDRAKQKARDADKDKVLKDAGVALLRFREMPSKDVLVLALSRLEAPAEAVISNERAVPENPAIKKPAVPVSQVG